MILRRWGVPVLLFAALLALWLLLAGPSRVLGVDPGHAGMVLLVATAWASLHAVRSLPRGALDHASPGEWRARIGAGFMAVAIAYFAAKLHVFQDEALPHAPHAAAVGRNLVLLLVAWSVLSSVLAGRWKPAVREDERDREIAGRAAGWGRGALVAAVVAIAVLLAFSPADRLQWASHLLVANLLVLALMAGCLAEYLAAAALYWRDRR